MVKVLVIDDESMILNLVQHALQRSHFMVETADNGRKGIAKFDAGRFDLVITDVRMPDTDGHRVLRHIRNSRRKATPVIGMSATPWELSGQAFDSVLTKPFHLDNLTRTAMNLTAAVS